MKQLITETEINASPEIIWNILMDITKYPDWNPFIRSVDKEFKEGEKLTITLHQPGSKPMKFKPTCLKVEPAKELRWLGHLLIPGLFDGEHIFELETLENGHTRFIQREDIKGILVPLFWKMLNTKTMKGFESMNLKLKELAENKK